MMVEFGGKGEPSENIESFITDVCMDGHGFGGDANVEVYQILSLFYTLKFCVFGLCLWLYCSTRVRQSNKCPQIYWDGENSLWDGSECHLCSSKQRMTYFSES